MIKTTAAYKEAIKKNRIFHHKASIDFSDGSNASVEDLDIYTFQIADATSNTNSFDVGAAIAQQLTLKLNNIDGRFDSRDFNNAIITAQIGLELQGGLIEWLDKGKFIAEPGEESGNTITVKAFDNMIRFDQPYSNSKLTYPATLGTIVRDACSCCGVILAPDTASFENDDFIVQNRPDDTALTFRQVLQQAGQIACKFFKINPDGKLSAYWYDTDTLEATWVMLEDSTLLDIDGNVIEDTDGNPIGTVAESILIAGGKASIDVETTDKLVKIENLLSGSTVQTDDVVITGIRVIEEDNTDGTAETVYQSGTDGYMLEISGNKLIQGGSGAIVASYLGERLNGLQFRPMSVSTPTDPAIEAGDIGLVVDTRGRYHKTIITNVTYTAHATQNLVSGAEAPTRLSSTRYSQITQAYKELRANMRKQKKEWDVAFEELQHVMETKNGLFPIHETMEDGSTILYFCDRPALEDSTIVVKFSAAGWAMSTDGGNTWNSGWLVDGTMIASILNAIGINAKWINTGALTVKDADGNIIFEVDIDKNSVYINPEYLMIGDVSLSAKIKEMDENIAMAKNMTMTLSNEYQAISTDENGDISGEFPLVQTTVQVMYGANDVTDECSYTVTESESVTGNWDKTSHTYTVTEIAADNAWIDIKAVYLSTLTITRRFSLSKQKSGTPGRTYILEPSVTILKRESEDSITPNVVSFSAYYRDGAEQGKLDYVGRFVIQETSDGKTWKTVYTSAEDENSINYYTDYIFADSDGVLVADNDGSLLGVGSKDIAGVRCNLYAPGDTDVLIDTVNIDVITEVTALTQEDILKLLTNDGEWKGLYRGPDGELYISFSAAMGGLLKLGGKNNGNGVLYIYDTRGRIKATLNYNGLTVYRTPLDPTSTASQKYSGLLFDGASIHPIEGKTNLADDDEIIIIDDRGVRFDRYDENNELIFEAEFQELHAGLCNCTEFYCKSGNATLDRMTIAGGASIGGKATVAGDASIGGAVTVGGTLKSHDIDADGLVKADRFRMNKELVSSSGGNNVGVKAYESGSGGLASPDYWYFYKVSSSSKRYKDIGDTITSSEIEEWYKIEPLWAKYKDGYLMEGDENEGRYLPMFIAEDVEEHFPQAATHMNGQVEDWNYRVMIPAMFAMLKQQKSEIEDLKTDVKELRKIIKEMRGE